LFKAVLRERGLTGRADADVIRRRGPGESALATPLQEALWFLEQLESDASVYVVPSAIRLAGPLDTLALERALNEIVKRHEILRTVYVAEAGAVQQVVREHTPFQLNVVDMSAEDHAAREERARDRVARESRRPFKLDSEIPFRAFMIRLRDEEHVLALDTHHIAIDGYSIGILTRELVALYSAFAENRPSPLPDLPIQFADYAAWQRERLSGRALERQTEFWRRVLGPPLPVLELPTDSARPRRLSGRGMHEPVHVPAALAARIRSFSRTQRITTFETLLAGFVLLLYGYSAQEDIIVGAPVANRARTELEGLIGYFVNVLPFRIDLRGDPSFGALAKRAHRASQDVQSHQEIPFAKIVEALQPPRDASRNPIYQVELTLLEPRDTPPVYGYGFQMAAADGLRLGNVAASPFPVESGVSKFDLTMLLWNLTNGIHGTIEYSTDLFRPQTIRRMSNDFVRLLDRALARPEARLRELVAAAEASAKPSFSAVRRRVIRMP
jgi:hypothetical protein